MQRRNWQDDAFVIHRRPYRETSLLVTVFTQENGIISVCGRGARRAKSKLACLQAPFQRLHLTVQSRQTWHNVLQAETQSQAIWLQGERLWCGLYLNELLYRLCRSGDHHELFTPYEATLDALNSGAAIQPTLRCFEGRLLEELGHAIPYYQLEEIDSEQVNYDPEHGFTPSLSHAHSYNRATLTDLAAQHFDQEEVLSTAKRLHRQLINHLLDGRKLQSRQFWQPASSPEGSELEA